MSGFVTAMRTLTALPCPGSDAKKMASALPWFPAVGLLLGGLLCGAAVAVQWLTRGLWPVGTAGAVVILSVLLTRGLHLDGLADWADGFWGSTSRKKVLVIMKDSAVGSFGAVALICVLLAKWICITRLLADGAALWIVAAYVVSRAMQAYLAAVNPYARAGGGTASPYVTESERRHALWAVGVAATILLAVFLLNPVGIAALAAGWGITSAFGIWCRRRVGGVTGDLIGACSELVETAILAAGGVLSVVTAGV